MRHRLVLVLAAVLGALGLLVVQAPAALAAGDNYVALGDSYSSGVGAGNYTAESGELRPQPERVLRRCGQRATPRPRTCRWPARARRRLTSRPANSSALSASTTLVSITIGGNDVNFADDHGGLQPLQRRHLRQRDPGRRGRRAAPTCPGKLGIAVRPDPLRTRRTPAWWCSTTRDFYDLAYDCIGLSQTKRSKIDEGIDVLDGITADAASAAGFTFADVRGAFAGHEICDGNRWLHSVNFSDFSESYHPTADGQSRRLLPGVQRTTRAELAACDRGQHEHLGPGRHGRQQGTVVADVVAVDVDVHEPAQPALLIADPSRQRRIPMASTSRRSATVAGSGRSTSTVLAPPACWRSAPGSTDAGHRPQPDDRRADAQHVGQVRRHQRPAARRRRDWRRPRRCECRCRRRPGRRRRRTSRRGARCRSSRAGAGRP